MPVVAILLGTTQATIEHLVLGINTIAGMDFTDDIRHNILSTTDRVHYPDPESLPGSICLSRLKTLTIENSVNLSKTKGETRHIQRLAAAILGYIPSLETAGLEAVITLSSMAAPIHRRFSLEEHANVHTPRSELRAFWLTFIQLLLPEMQHRDFMKVEFHIQGAPCVTCPSSTHVYSLYISSLCSDEGHVSARPASSDARWLAGDGSNPTVIAWDTENCQYAWGWIVNKGPVNGLMFFPDGKHVLSINRTFAEKAGELEANTLLVATLSDNTVPRRYARADTSAPLTAEYSDGTERAHPGPDTFPPIQPHFVLGGSPLPHNRRLHHSPLPGTDPGSLSSRKIRTCSRGVASLPPPTARDRAEASHEVFRGRSDQAFHVTFAPAGRQVRITPKDHSVSVWA